MKENMILVLDPNPSLPFSQILSSCSTRRSLRKVVLFPFPLQRERERGAGGERHDWVYEIITISRTSIVSSNVLTVNDP